MNHTRIHYQQRGTFGSRAVAFAMSQPDDVDVNEILFQPTRQKL